MKVLSAILFAALAISACEAAQGGLRQSAPGTATAMAGLEGEACGVEEYSRYKTIVCTVTEACGCAPHKCELEWCLDYVHTWKKDFGACILKGCDWVPPKEGPGETEETIE